MTKRDIAKQLAERYKMTNVDVQDVVQGTFDAILEALAKHGRIELRNFGVFEVRQRAARKARNPRTGEAVQVPAKKVVVFKPGRIMEEKIR
jgi:nucleoid DNA-binding protein